MADAVKKVSRASYKFADAEGNKSRSPTEDTTTLIAYWKDDVTTEYSLTDLPPAMRACCAPHGLKQKLGDNVPSGAAPAEARESWDETYALLLEGVWSQKGEGRGTSPSMAAEAIRNCAIAQGHEISDEKFAEICGRMANSEARTAALKNLDIGAEYEKLRAAKAAERAKAAAKKAKGTKTNILAMYI